MAKALVGSERLLAARFEALSSHYLFEACFCRPRTGHDKGGVESRGKAIRWQHLVPIPRGDDLGVIRAALLARLDAEHDQSASPRSERNRCRCPRRRSTRDARTRRASRSARSCASKAASTRCHASGLASTSPRTSGADDVDIVGPDRTVHHARKRFGERSIDYRHYVRELAKKPQAVRQVAAELTRDLGPSFVDAWRALVDAHGPKQGARIFAKVLAYVETRGVDSVASTISQSPASEGNGKGALSPAPRPSWRRNARARICSRARDGLSFATATPSTWPRRMKDRGRDAYQHLWKRIEPELGALYIEEVDTSARSMRSSDRFRSILDRSSRRASAFASARSTRSRTGRSDAIRLG